MGDERQDQIVVVRRYLVEPSLAEFAFDVVLGRETETAMGVEGSVAGFPRGIAGQELGHVGFGPAGLTCVEEVTGLPSHEVCGFEMDLGLGQRGLHALVHADRAVEMGMAARKFSDEELLPAAMVKAREIAQWPVSALRGIKQTLQVANRGGIEAARLAEDEGMAKYAGSPENMEAVMAFMEKRPADFKKFRH